MIEGDLRKLVRSPRRLRRSRNRRRRPRRTAGRTARRDAAASRSPNCPIPPRHRSISPPRRGNSRPRRRRCRPQPPCAPRAISEILEPHAAPPRAAIAPDLPPDHPLEPGTRPSGRVGFAIGAHRRFGERDQRNSGRRARAGQHVEFHCRRAPCRPGGRRGAGRRQGRPRPAQGARPRQGQGCCQGTIDDHVQDPLAAGRRQRGRHRARHLQDGDDAARRRQRAGNVPPHGEFERPPPAQPPAEDGARPAMPRAGGTLDDLADPDRPAIAQRRARRNFPTAPRPTPDPANRPPMPSAAPVSASDITGTIPAANRAVDRSKLALVQIPPTERLPDAIGGPVLRAAALKGDPAAAYEIGVRYAEGKGVAPNLDEAAKWYDRAAQAGVVPAIFRLGTLYEKGLSVKKDVDIARRYYMQAAERGNAKAMHNLAVLDCRRRRQGRRLQERGAMVPQGGRPRRRRQPVQSRHPVCPRHRRRTEPRRILQMVQPGRGAGRRGLGSQARRYRQAARPAVARGGEAGDPDLHGGTAARRRRQRSEPARRMGQRAGQAARQSRAARAGFDQARRPLIRIIHHVGRVGRRSARKAVRACGFFNPRRSAISVMQGRGR